MFESLFYLTIIAFTIWVFVKKKRKVGQPALQSSRKLGTDTVEERAKWPEDLDLINALQLFLDEKVSNHGYASLSSADSYAHTLLRFNKSLVSSGEHFEQVLSNLNSRRERDDIQAFLRDEELDDLAQLLEQWFEFADEDAKNVQFRSDISKALDGERVDRTDQPTAATIAGEFKRRAAVSRYQNALHGYLTLNYDWRNAPLRTPDELKSPLSAQINERSARVVATRPETSSQFSAVRTAAHTNCEHYRYSELDEVELNVIRFNEFIYAVQDGDFEHFLKETHDDVFASHTIALLNATREADIIEVVSDLIVKNHRYYHHATDFSYSDLSEAEDQALATLKAVHAVERLTAIAEYYVKKNYSWR